MLLNLFFEIIEILLRAVAVILPNYERLELPAEYLNFIVTISYFFIEVAATPIFRVFAFYFITFFFVFVSIVWFANIGLSIINFVRGTTGLKL